MFLVLLLASITGGLLSLYVDFRAVSTVLYGEPGAAAVTANFPAAITRDHPLNAHTLEAPSFGESSHTLKWLNEAVNASRAYMIEHFEEMRTMGKTCNVTSLREGVREDVIRLNEANDDDYLETISQLRHVISLQINWNMETHTEHAATDLYPLVNTRHGWSLTPGACAEQDKKSDCFSHQSNTTVITDELVTEPWEPTFLHVIPNGTLHPWGFVKTEHVEFLPNSCMSPRVTHIHNYTIKSFAKEVFVISSYWGGGFFHMSNDGLPRLVPYLPFLKANPAIKIHVLIYTRGKPYSGPAYIRYFKLLGLSPSRLVKGSVRADIIYLPKGGNCYMIGEPNGQMFSQVLRSSIRKLYPLDVASPTKTLVLIQRTKSRQLVQHADIKTMLEGVAKQSGLQFEVYSDDPMPNERDTWLMFYRAVMIVAPHGAGLSNMLLSRPGVYVVEVLCADDINLCYSDLAFGQGNYYRGIGATRGCERGMTVNVTQVIEAVQAFLEQDAKINSAQRLAS